MGKDLYGALIAMLRWGVAGCRVTSRPPILTHYDCGANFQATIICDKCRKPLHAKDMSYRLSHRPKEDGRPKKPGRPAVIEQDGVTTR